MSHKFCTNLHLVDRFYYAINIIHYNFVDTKTKVVEITLKVIQDHQQ